MTHNYKKCSNLYAHTPHQWSVGDVWFSCPGRIKDSNKAPKRRTR